ncbi:hypothetical protein BpHYR1_031480 [Brachionus plicatilis]|uniref:Uncharacterized protein n=1 Tax=Brachionus plicatilis TaxID=10195 RepID=A0A3M7PNC2_BRAPC|nr:hypothetical protein BpHYR1_031480 [Brachionus plicatilis]
MVNVLQIDVVAKNSSCCVTQYVMEAIQAAKTNKLHLITLFQPVNLQIYVFKKFTPKNVTMEDSKISASNGPLQILLQVNPFKSNSVKSKNIEQVGWYSLISIMKFFRSTGTRLSRISLNSKSKITLIFYIFSKILIILPGFTFTR